MASIECPVHRLLDVERGLQPWLGRCAAISVALTLAVEVIIIFFPRAWHRARPPLD